MLTMSSQDLFTIQQQLKKTILAHQIAVSKLKTDPQNQILKKELHELQNCIKTLSEEQKLAVQRYREQMGLMDKSSENIDTNQKIVENGVTNSNSNNINSNNSNNISNSNNNNKLESIKPIIPRPALIIPQLGPKQSVAINTQSIRRPALAIKSITGQTQFLVPVSNSSMKNKLLVVPKQRVFNYLKPVVKMPTISSSLSSTSSSCSTTTSALKSSTNAQQLHSTSILIRSNSKSPTKVPLVKSLNNNRTAPKLTDKQIKDHFMSSLGLVTKEALTELQSRKCERKRRTTANPQFSSAALEAKRISKLEIAERKAKRRLLITNNGDTCVSQTKTTYLNNGTNAKTLGIEQQEISPGVHIVTSIGNFPTANCVVCDELCECDSDSILFCKFCRALFHATCSLSKADITKKATVPCPKCENLKKKTDEKVAKKREERDNLSAKKKDLDEQMAQMRQALNSLKQKLKEKSDEKTTLVANNSAVQQKVDKIMDTLKLVEDTSEWEDGFAAALEATAPKEDTEVEVEIESDSKEVEAMDAETEEATAQLEQLVKAETNSLEMETDANDIYQLQCHENGAEMYDIFVEEVQESVDMVSDNVGFFDTEETHEQHIKGPEYGSEEHHVVLY